MPNMDKVGNNWELELNIAAAGDKSITFPTKDKFVDANVQITVSTPAGALSAGSTSASVTDTASILTESSTQPSSGEYITVTAQGVVTVGTAGFLAAGTAQSTTQTIKYYKIQNASFAVDGASVKTTQKGYVGANQTVGTVPNGALTVDGGGLSSGAKSTAIASNGYYNGSSYDTSDKVTLATAEASGYYKITSSGSVTVNRAAVTKEVTSGGYFATDSSPVTAIAADSLNVVAPDHAYYIKKSTLSSNTITPSTTTQQVTISEGYYPSNRVVTINPMTGGTIATQLADVGLSTYFNPGTSSDKDVTLTPQYTNTAGYFDAHSTATNAGGIEYYKIKTTTIDKGVTTVSGTTVDRGIASWNTGWITGSTIPAATFTNTPTSPKTANSYVNISNTSAAPVLVAGDYLYINAGYTDDLRISLARLVPDGSDVKGHSEYILSGHSAYDNDGVLVAGSIQTYDGSYTVA